VLDSAANYANEHESGRLGNLVIEIIEKRILPGTDIRLAARKIGFNYQIARIMQLLNHFDSRASR
jgi:hypothetical protein